MKIYHLALESDWALARRTGSYTTSTLGRSLAEEGFIHASRRDQVAAVSRTFYRNVRRPLVKLEIDTDRLTSPWSEEPVGADTYPHIHGPLNVDAVTAVRPWHRSGREKSLPEVYMHESLFRIALAILVMLLAFFGSYVGVSYGEHGQWAGALMGIAVGSLLCWLTLRGRTGRSA